MPNPIRYIKDSLGISGVEASVGALKPTQVVEDDDSLGYYVVRGDVSVPDAVPDNIMSLPLEKI